MRHWPVMRRLNLLGTHYLLGHRAAWLPCALAPHLGLVATSAGSDAQTFTAGRALERVWLQATQLGLALQPMPASILYSQGDGGSATITTRFSGRLRDAWKELLPNAVPQMLFRLGHAAKPSILSGRVAADHLLKNGSGI